MPKIIYKTCPQCNIEKKKTYDFDRYKKSKKKYIYYDICKLCSTYNKDNYIIPEIIIICT